MPEGSPQTPSTEPPPGSGEGQQPTETPPQTVEEVEAIWRNRVSGKDRAHNAEVTTLRGQIETLQAQIAAHPVPADGGEPDPRDAEVKRLTQELDRERAARSLDARKAKFPFAAESLDEETLARMDEAKLAALNERLNDEAPIAGSGSTTLDPNRASRRTAPPTPPSEKSVDDLKSDLRRYAPEFVASLNE